jgi:hypothetical protein
MITYPRLFLGIGIPLSPPPYLLRTSLKRLPVEVRVSHISQKTSEIWGTL